MDDRQFYDLMLISILSFQFHPKNEKIFASPSEIEEVIDAAMLISFDVTKRRNELWPG